MSLDEYDGPIIGKRKLGLETPRETRFHDRLKPLGKTIFKDIFGNQLYVDVRNTSGDILHRIGFQTAKGQSWKLDTVTYDQDYIPDRGAHRQRKLDVSDDQYALRPISKEGSKFEFNTGSFRQREVTAKSRARVKDNLTGHRECNICEADEEIQDGPARVVNHRTEVAGQPLKNVKEVNGVTTDTSRITDMKVRTNLLDLW